MIGYRIDSDFYGNSRMLIVQGEAYRENLYADMVGIPTIGYGHALIAKGKKSGKDFYDLHLPNLGDFPLIGITLTQDHRNQLAAIAAKLNEGNVSDAKALTAKLDASIRDIEEPEAALLYRRAFDRALNGVKVKFKSILGPTSGEQLFAELSGSTEMIAIASLGYNNPGTLVGAGIVNSLWQGNRAEAWFEIRYNSNGGDTKGPGIAKRRYAEAGVFGLYDNPAAYANSALISAEEAKSVYRMYQLHRASIDLYEKDYGGQAGFANLDFQLVGTVSEARGLIDSLIPAQTALFGWLRQENPSLTDLYPENYLATNIYIDPGRDFAIDPTTRQAVLLDPNHVSVLNARKYDSQSSEIASNDILIGEGGNDDLIGGKGDDILLGGTGFDTYVWNTGDGDDRILDLDRRGRILINGSAAKLLVQKTATTWVSHDGKLTLTQPADSSGGWKLDIAGGGSLDLGSSLNDGDYGLYRQDAAPVLPTDPTIVGDRSPKEFTANFTGTIDYNKFGLGWYNSRITVTAEHADPEDATKSIVDAYKVTYNTKDALGNYVTEGDGSAPNRNDTLNGDATQADYIQAFGGNDEIDAKGGNDRIQAGTGDDLVSGGAGHDLVEGGSGADRLLGGDGRDTLWGDTTATGSTPIASAIASGETDASQNSKGDWIDGGTGDDILIGGTANDVLVAGAENDLLIGGAGDDLLLGDGIGQINPAASWSTGRQVSTDPDTKITSYTATFSGSSATWFSQFGGADMLYGGAGDDWVFAGAGDDQVDGGKGQDVLFGEAGNDVVLGGLDDDLIIGDSAGLAESLQGHDWLDGGEGDDTLEGMGGDDVLIGGKGDDSLVGGAGRDTYIYNKGDGVDTVIDDDTGAEKSILVFGEGVSKDSIKLRKGSLLLDLGNGDGVHIENFNADDPLGTQSIGSFNFADGTSLRATRLLSRRSEAAHRSRRWKDGASIGTESNDIYWRSVA